MAVNDIFLEESAKFFKQNAEIESFGWYQWNTGATLNKVMEVYNTIEKPDINGNVGEFLWDIDNLERQDKVSKFLQQFDPILLRVTFGENVGVFVYNDLSIETEKYDPFLAMALEL